MDLCLALQSIHDELLTFFPNESGVTTSHSLHGTGQRRTGLKTPPFPWTVATSLKLLAQYSSGLTREILLTDLESFWRRELRRGSASTVQLTPIIAQSKSHSSSSSSPALTKTDVLTGSVVLRPSGKYQLVDSERQAIDFIPHRQMSDFNGFLSHMLRLSSYHSLPQLCAFTQCRILQLTPSSPPILLPSEITSPIFDYSLPSDATAIQLCFTPLHQNFCSSLASSLPSFSDESVTGLFAEVTYISSVLPYPVPAMNKQYRIIKLRFYSDIRETVTLTTPMKRSRSSPRAVFLILYENHVELATLWRVGSLLFLYRPYMMLNSEELLFGTSTLQTSSAFTHSVVYRQCDIISSLLAANAEVIPPDEFVSFHLLYGCITVCALVKNLSFQASSAAGETRSLLETPSRSKRKGVLSRYKLEECENFFIDASLYNGFISAEDILEGMTGLSFFGQVLRIIDDSLYVLPLKMQMTACSEPNAVECIGPEDGVLSIPLSSIQMKRNDIESGSLIYLSNARVVRILRGDKGSPCPRIIHCAFDSEAGLSLYHLPSLPAIPNSPSIFPSSTLVLLTQRCHAKGVKEGVFSQTQMSVTTCYIRPSRKLNEQDLRASFEVLLFDGTTAAIVALLHVGTLILSAKFQQERGLWTDSNVGRTDSWLQQYTLLLSSSRRTQGSGFDGRSSATPAPAWNVFIDVITDLNVGALTSSYLNAM